MSFKGSARKRCKLAGKILCLALLVAAALQSRKTALYLDPYGLLFVLAGGVAGALMTFSGREIRAAFMHAGGAAGNPEEVRRSALFWEATAGNFWLLGVLRSILSFVISLGSLSGGLSALTSGLTDSLLAALYGMVLAVICYVPYWKLEEKALHPVTPDGTATPALPAVSQTPNWQFTHIAGYALFLAILVSTLAQPSVAEIGAAVKWIIYWPSLLVVLGGTLALLLFLGEPARKSAISPGFAVTGLIGSLMGVVQVLLGFSAGSIEDISSAVTFILSSCFAALMGMFLLGAPLEHRAAKSPEERAQAPLRRTAWYFFPLLALILLVAVFVLVVTPFEKQQ